MRVQLQNEKPISVIIGNPPYNDSAVLNGRRITTRSREYPEIDRRIRETYIKESTAQKTHQYDMYKRFIRWASDRLANDDGIIAFHHQPRLISTQGRMTGSGNSATKRVQLNVCVH